MEQAEGSGPSADLIELKRQYHENRRDIADVTVEDERARIHFSDDASPQMIESTSPDFVEEANQMVQTVRRGEELFVPISKLPVGDVNQYKQNLSLFDLPSKNPINHAINRANAEEIPVPDDINLRVAARAAVQLDLQNDDLQKAVMQYDGMIALIVSDLRKYENQFTQMMVNSYSTSRFIRHHSEVLTLLQSKFSELPPIGSMETYIDRIETDFTNIGQRFANQKERALNFWTGMASESGDGEANIKYWQNGKLNQEEVGTTGIDDGFPQILNQYAELYELAREPLADLAFCLDENAVDSPTDTSSVVEYLKSNNAQSLADSIEPDLRHGKSHSAVEFDKETGQVSVYDGRGRSRSLKRRYDAQEVFNSFYAISDLMKAIVLAFTTYNYTFMFQFFWSKDFRHHIAENATHGTFE